MTVGLSITILFLLAPHVKIVLRMNDYATYPPSSCGVGTIINIQMVMAVHVKSVKLEEEFLQYGFGLEADNAVLIPFIPAVQNDTIHSFGNVGHKVSILTLRANLAHCI